jgi:DNA-binding NarL/FixJ family response regulator
MATPDRVLHFSPDHRRKIALAKMGRALSPDHREAIAEANTGRSKRISDGVQVRDRTLALRRQGLTITAISAELHVSRSTVFNIISGQHWTTKR